MMNLELVGEFIGTMMLVLLGDGVIANVSLPESKGKNAGWLVINIGWGMALLVAALVAGYMSPAHFNPAVTLAFAVAGKFAWANVLPYVLAQTLGAMLGATLVWLVYRPHFEATQEAGTILGVFATAPAIKTSFYNLVAEIVGTFVLTFGILSMSMNKMADGFGPIIVAALLLSVGVSLGGPTGYAINPARDLGPRIMHAILPISKKGASDWGYAWIPVVGPCLGGLLAAFVFMLING